MIPAIRIIILVAISWIIAEIIKTAVASVKKRKFMPAMLYTFGGMPSTHAALVAALCTSIYCIDGFTTAFVISIALLVLVSRDALAIRGAIDGNTAAIARISRNKYRQRLIAHKPLELLVGIVIGIVLPLVLNAII